MYDVDSIRKDLLDDDKGFWLLKGFYTSEEVDSYRRQCNDFLQSGRVRYARINTDRVRDYIHPRSYDDTSRTYRIYQYFHNHRNDLPGQIFSRATMLRDEIENAWMDEPVYRSEKMTLQDYSVVTYYLQNKGKLLKHRDYEGPAPFPLIQFWVMLSRPERDYKGGNLVIYPRSGRQIRVEADLNIEKGDAVIFDKKLLHEVEQTEGAEPDMLGRWTLLIGARAKRDSRWKSLYKDWMYRPTIYPLRLRLSRFTTRLRRKETLAPAGAK